MVLKAEGSPPAWGRGESDARRGSKKRAATAARSGFCTLVELIVFMGIMNEIPISNKGPNGGNAFFLQDAESVRPGRDGGQVRWVRSRDEGGMNGSDFMRDRLDEATYVSLAV